MKGKRTKKAWMLACCLGLATSLSAQLSKQELAKQEVLKHTNIEELNRLSAKFSKEYKENKAKALELAKEKGWMTRKEYSNGMIIELQGVDKSGKPIYEQTYNSDAAETISTNLIYPGGSMGLSLTGQGMTVGEWDGGAVRTSHQEFGGRVFQADGATTYSNHATHVAGTMVAAGVVSAARGMAYEADLDAYDWSNDNSEMSNAAANGLLISNHSYGTITGWNYDADDNEWYWYGDVSISSTEDYNFGYYNYWDAESWDEIAYNAPYYLIVKSAGNDRNDSHNGQHYVLDNGGNWVTSSDSRDADGGAAGYDCVSTGGNAKNVLTVGAVSDISGGYSSASDVNMSSFSGWGPTDDGRIKPDVVGNGIGLYSTYADNNSDYGSSNGTSMSAPNVSGSMLLLQQHYLNEEGAYMRSASLKGLVIHTADEAGTTEGPDYVHGWGLMNTATAAAFISNPSKILVESNLQGGTTYQQAFFASGNEPIRATLCWTDVKYNSLGATLNSTAATLINDLDIRIEDASGTIYQPYILNPASPTSAATTGDNVRDNVEQIYIDVPTAGLYTITVSHKNSISGGSQDFSLLYEGGEADPNAFCGSWEDAWSESTSTAQSSGFTLTKDASGNTYVAGRFISDLTVGGTTISSGGNIDIFLIKYNSTNNPVWIKHLTGSNDNFPQGLTTDASGNVYLAGYYDGTINVAGTTLTATNGASTSFLAKFDANGNVSWARDVDGSTGATNFAFETVADVSGNVYLAGYFYGTATFATGTSLTNTAGTGARDSYIAKYNSSGTLVWVQKYGSATSTDAFFALDIDDNNNLYAGGYYAGTATYGTNTYTATSGVDAVVARINSSTGAVVWSANQDGTGNQYVNKLKTDAVGDVYAMFTYDGQFSFGATTYPYLGNNDVGIMKVSNGTPQWMKTLNSTNSIGVEDITVSGDKVFAMADFSGSLGIDGSSGISSNGDDDFMLFISGLDGTGASVTSWGGTGADGSGDIFWQNDKLYATGYFSTSLTLDNNTLSSTLAEDMFVGILAQAPVPTVNAGNDMSIACGELVNFNATVSNSSNYTWTSGSGLSDINSLTPTANPTSTTTFTLSAVNTCGQSYSDDIVVTVDPNLGMSVNAGIDETTNCGVGVQLGATTPFAGTYTVSWTPSSGLSDPTILNPIATPASTQNYMVRVYNLCGVQVSDQLQITVNPIASPTISFNGNDLVCNISGATSYQWYYNGTLVPGGNTQNFTPTGNGTYVVVVVDGNGCPGTSSSFTYPATTEVTNIEDTNIRLFPNPTSGQFVIDLGEVPSQVWEFDLYDATGRQLRQAQLSTQNTSIDIQDLASGVYYIKLKNAEQSYSLSLIKE